MGAAYFGPWPSSTVNKGGALGPGARRWRQPRGHGRAYAVNEASGCGGSTRRAVNAGAAPSCRSKQGKTSGWPWHDAEELARLWSLADEAGVDRDSPGRCSSGGLDGAWRGDQSWRRRA